MITVGTEMPAWSRQTDFAHWNRFAAVNDEFIPIHMDDEAGRAAGNATGAFGMGNLRFAYIANALRDWFGEDAEIVEIGCRYRRLNQKNDGLTVTGRVVEVSGLEVRLEVDVVNQAGEGTTPGHAVIALPPGWGKGWDGGGTLSA